MKRVTMAVCDECGFENSKDNFCENCNKEIQWSTFVEEAEYKQAATDLARITAELGAYKKVCDGKTPDEMDEWMNDVLAAQKLADKKLDELIRAIHALKAETK